MVVGFIDSGSLVLGAGMNWEKDNLSATWTEIDLPKSEFAKEWEEVVCR